MAFIDDVKNILQRARQIAQDTGVAIKVGFTIRRNSYKVLLGVGNARDMIEFGDAAGAADFLQNMIDHPEGNKRAALKENMLHLDKELLKLTRRRNALARNAGEPEV